MVHFGSSKAGKVVSGGGFSDGRLIGLPMGRGGVEKISAVYHLELNPPTLLRVHLYHQRRSMHLAVQFSTNLREKSLAEF